jgi:hypothetical protein
VSARYDPFAVILNPSAVMLSEAKHLGCPLRVNSVKDQSGFQNWPRSEGRNYGNGEEGQNRSAFVETPSMLRYYAVAIGGERNE